VLGYLVEAISGQPFEDYLVEKVIRPLGMTDTDFYVPKAKHDRLAANYGPGPGGKLDLIDDPAKSRYLAPRNVNSGGGGLVSTAADYLRFCKMMLNKGELDGVRLLGRKTVELMTRIHSRATWPTWACRAGPNRPDEGVGFGFGFAVMPRSSEGATSRHARRVAWVAPASTAFWCDPRRTWQWCC
jgi:CubicO group peptidase (beta-lactamase class C family)